MVLEEASAPADAGFMDNESPASDADPYSSQAAPTGGQYIEAQPPPNQILIPFDSLPSARFFFSLASNNDLKRLQSVMIRQRCDSATKIMHRPLRQEEAEAFAQNTTHALKLSTSGTPIGLAMGAFRAFQTRAKCSFPGGWAPSMTDEGRFKYNKVGPLEGQWARMFWQATRLQAHAALWVIASQLFFASYGLSVLTVRIASDGRLKEYNEAMRKRAAENKAPVRDQDISGTTQNETFEQRRQRRNVQEIVRNGNGGPPRTPQQRFHDASPTGGSFETEVSNFDVHSELLSDRQTTQRNREAWPSESPDTQQPTTSSPLQQRTQRSEDPLDSMSSSSTSEKYGGSAWDRLRQQAIQGKSKPTDRSA